MMKYYFLNLLIISLLLTVFDTTTLYSTDGKWTPVRRANWEYDMGRVIFRDIQHGFIKGRHNQLLITDNGGQNWMTCFFPDSIVDKMLGVWGDMDILSNKDIWLMEDEGILLKIPNSNEPWKYYMLPERPILRGISFPDEKNGWLAGYYGEIFRSVNGGKNWKQLYHFNRLIWDICFIDTLTGFVTVRKDTSVSQCYKTTDGGQSWDLIIDPDIYIRKILFKDHQFGWILGDYNQIFITADAGQNWEKILVPETAMFKSIYFISPKIGWLCGDSGLMLYTEDGGKTWLKRGSPTFNSINDVFFVDQQHGWAVATYGIIATTSDGGYTWHWQMEVPSNYLISVHFLNERTGFSIGKNIFISTFDGGQTWQQTDSLTGHEIQFVDSQNGWMAAMHSIYHTTDGGKTWMKQAFFKDHYITNLSFADQFNGWALSVTEKKTTIFRTRNGGDTWEELPPLSGDLYSLQFISANEGWIVGGAGRILHTLDSGLSWELQREGQATLWNCLNDIDFVDSEYGWAVGFKGQIWHTKNGGKNWELQQSTIFIDDILYSVDFMNRNEGWIAGHIGTILHTTDGGKTWDWSYSQYMGYWWSDIFFTDANHGWIVGLYGAVDKFLGDDVLSVPEFSTANIRDFSLQPGYPNPMQNKTMITYFLPIEFPISLEIYDITGRKVRTLEKCVKYAGYHSVNWDGLNDDGQPVANGTYLYYLRAGKRFNSQKLTIIR